MSCGNSVKNKNMKSCEIYFNNNAQAFVAGSTTVLQIAGTRVVDTGISIETQPSSYTTLKKGLYHIAGDVVINVATAGIATLSVYMDGVQMPCTIKPLDLPDGQFPVHTETDLYLDSCCCDVSHTFTFVLTSTTMVGTVTNVCTGIIKEA